MVKIPHERYVVPKYHEELFNTDEPKTTNEILEKIFGYSGTDVLETWSRSDIKTKESTSKFFYDINVSDLRNYCCEPGWQYVYPRNKHVILIEDIKENGIKVPLLVIEREQPSGIIYWVVEGHHRAGAAKLLDMKKVKAFVLVLRE